MPSKHVTIPKNFPLDDEGRMSVPPATPARGELRGGHAVHLLSESVTRDLVLQGVPC